MEVRNLINTVALEQPQEFFRRIEKSVEIREFVQTVRNNKKRRFNVVVPIQKFDFGAKIFEYQLLAASAGNRVPYSLVFDYSLRERAQIQADDDGFKPPLNSADVRIVGWLADTKFYPIGDVFCGVLAVRLNLQPQDVSKSSKGEGDSSMSESPRIARRDFLAGIGRAAGGSAMLRIMAAMGITSSLAACGSSSANGNTPPRQPGPNIPPRAASPRPGDWPANVGNGRSVLILGAGIAGMVAAIEMRKLGYACTILEAQAAAGGRVRTLRSGDVAVENDSTQVCQFDVDDELYFNAGPSRIPQHHEFIVGYCREYGVALETFTNDNRGAWLHSPSAFAGEPQVARRLIAETRSGISALLSTAINQNALDQELTATDRANVLSLLREFGALAGDGSAAPTARAGFPGQEDVGSRQRDAVLSLRELQDLAGSVFWEQRLSFTHGLNQQPTMLQPVGGMDRIVRALETEVVADTLYEARVDEIRKTSAGARVVFTDRTGLQSALEAEHCIVTLPATVLAGIPNDFSTAHRAEISGFRYSTPVRIAFQAPRFWEQGHSIYGGISWTDQEITQIWYPNNAFQSQHGILLGAYIFDGPAGATFTGLSPEQRVDRARLQAANVHPEFNTQAQHGISVAWSKVPYQLGGWGTSTPAVLLQPDDAIVFAGEHLSALQGWQEGAVVSAYAAIDQVVQRDLST